MCVSVCVCVTVYECLTVYKLQYVCMYAYRSVLDFFRKTDCMILVPVR